MYVENFSISINEQVSLNFDQSFTEFIFAKNVIVNSIIYIYLKGKMCMCVKKHFDAAY